jgi:hypothetical protein
MGIAWVIFVYSLIFFNKKLIRGIQLGMVAQLVEVLQAKRSGVHWIFSLYLILPTFFKGE